MTTVQAFYDEAVAKEAASVIRQFWHRAGFPEVTAHVERAPASKNDHGKTLFVVKSNLVNGMPKGAHPDAIARLYRYPTPGEVRFG